MKAPKLEAVNVHPERFLCFWINRHSHVDGGETTERAGHAGIPPPSISSDNDA